MNLIQAYATIRLSYLSWPNLPNMILMRIFEEEEKHHTFIAPYANLKLLQLTIHIKKNMQPHFVR